MNNPFELIEARLNNIETLLLDLKHKPQEQGEQPTETNRWLNIDDLIEYLPDKPKKQKIYKMTSKRTIPFHKGDDQKGLIFLKSDIDNWIKQGRRKTAAEISNESEQYFKNRKGRIAGNTNKIN